MGYEGLMDVELLTREAKVRINQSSKLRQPEVHAGKNKSFLQNKLSTPKATRIFKIIGAPILVQELIPPRGPVMRKAQDRKRSNKRLAWTGVDRHTRQIGQLEVLDA